MTIQVTMDACVAGNPHKAWKVRLPAGETSDNELAPDREPPDDVWEHQTHEFPALLDAKVYVEGLPAETTTHVLIVVDGETIFDQDADADHLDAAEPGLPMPHTITSKNPLEDLDAIAEAPPLMDPQGAV